MCDGPHAGFPRQVTLAAPKGGWPYTEATPSGSAPTSPPEGVFQHKGRMELDELSGRTTTRIHRAAAMHAGPTTATAPPRRWRSVPIRRSGLGARLFATSDEARAGYDLQFRQQFFLPDNHRIAVSDSKGLE